MEREYKCVRCQKWLWYQECIWHDQNSIKNGVSSKPYCAACVVDHFFEILQRGEWVRISIANLKSWLDHAEERGKINAEMEF